ncbi:hypothetical protein Ancab_014244 [Ancistrocladus abbreviatus]
MSQGGKLLPNLEQNGAKILNLTVLQRIDPCIEGILMTLPGRGRNEYFRNFCKVTFIVLLAGGQANIAELMEAFRPYAASWVHDIGPDLRPNDYKKTDGSEDKPGGVNGKSEET